MTQEPDRTQAISFTGGGIYCFYAASIVGDDELSWFGVDAYVWVGGTDVLVGLAWWVLLLVRPDPLSGGRAVQTDSDSIVPAHRNWIDREIGAADGATDSLAAIAQTGRNMSPPP